jgi:hypothetical protein
MEILANLTIVACEGLEKGSPVCLRVQRKAGELQPGRPALGSGLHEFEVGLIEAEVERAVQKGVRLLVVESELLRPNFRQLIGHPQAGERKRRVGAARDHDLQRARKVAEQVCERRVNQLVVQEVVVIENQHRPLRRSRELVDQRRQHHLDKVAPGTRKPRQRLVAKRRVYRPQSANQVAPEPNRVIVFRIEREPGERS